MLSFLLEVNKPVCGLGESKTGLLSVLNGNDSVTLTHFTAVSSVSQSTLFIFFTTITDLQYAKMFG